MRKPRRSLPLGLAFGCLALGALGSLAAGEPVGEKKAAESRALSPDGKTLVIEISGDIDLGLSSFIERVLKEVKAGDLVILHVNTFGGRIDAAVAIRDAVLSTPAHTVAFVDKRAISAGALISLAADTIVMASGATIGAATPVELQGGKMAPVEAKVVSYFRKEMKATAEAKGRRGDLAEAMVDAQVVIEGLDGKDTTLTLTTDEALKYKLAAFTLDEVGAICTRLGRSLGAGSPSVLRPDINWAERIARVLSQPAISSLLMTIGMLGILIELWSPGHAVAGALGVTCLLLFFFGHYVVHLAGWEEMLLFVAGVAMVAFEVFFWPGHGALAVLGVTAIVASLAMALLNVERVPFEITWQLGWVTRALVRVFGSILATAAAMLVLARFLPATRFGRSLILRQAITESAGAAAAQMSGMTAMGGGSVPEALVGWTGVADTLLRPAGKALVGGRRLDVVSEGDFIEAGTPVVVASVDGGRIVVRKRGA